MSLLVEEMQTCTFITGTILGWQFYSRADCNISHRGLIETGQHSELAVEMYRSFGSTPGFVMGVGLGKMLKFLCESLYVMGKALTGSYPVCEQILLDVCMCMGTGVS